MNLNAVRDFADREDALAQEIRNWYLENIHPRVVACETLADLDNIWGEVSRACTGNDGTMRDLPGPLHIERVFSYDSVRQKLNK